MHRSPVFLFLIIISGLFSAPASHADLPANNIGRDAVPDTIVIQQLIITGNKVTKLPIITRELAFSEKDTIAGFIFEKAIERTRENLMNTGIFNFVYITWQPLSGHNVAVVVDVRERWYIFPVPIFELVDRNFNEWWRSGDASRINYGFYLNWDNFRGMNETVKLQFRWGYSQRIGIYYVIPFISKKQEEGLSVGISYSRNREAGYQVESSKLLRYSDEGFVRRETGMGLRYTQRQGFYNYNYYTLEYRNTTINDSLTKLNPEYLGDGVKKQELLSFSWQFRRDRRDYKIYPLKGYLFDFEVTKYGIGILQNEPDLLYLQTQVKYYQPLADRWYWGGSVKGKLSGQSESAYIHQRGFGYQNDFVRGYEYYVIPGQNFLLFRNNLKFALLPTRVISLPWSVLEKFRTIPYAFYLNGYFDAGYVRDRQFGNRNPLANRWQYGYGAGIDYVTYYNLVFRMEFSVNKFGESGFFLHFTAPI
jgi:outer membrane protein assembly factor BamA